MENRPSTINTILIANRGEIASRIIRTCKKMGIRSVAVYSEADRNGLFVKEADMAIFIGNSSPLESYLDQDKMLAAAKKASADAIHPGYGFLSENADFARRCEKESIIFIGPNADAIAAMGSKSNAKIIMAEQGIPMVPGYQGRNQKTHTLKNEVMKIGLPVLLKASAGGGGKGMRIVWKEAEIIKAIESAKSESMNAFGDDELIIEKFISSGRHIEFQIFGDQHGNVVHLLERECTIQRRYQKVIEESPSPIMNNDLRDKMGAVAVNAAKALKYDNAGTVEFIYDDQSGEFYFLEVNTRLQVEHPVTEEITGFDLVQLQIESASGKQLYLEQDEIFGDGYALEVRLYAEDPSNNFMPVTGTVYTFEVPEVEGLRVETAIGNGSEISVYYDPMIAKLIVWDKTRHDAHRKMAYVLRSLICLGTTTNQQFLIQIVENKDFNDGKYNTQFIEEKLSKSNVLSNSQDRHLAGIAVCTYEWSKRDKSRSLLKSIPSGWRNSFNDYQKEVFTLNNEDLNINYRFKDQGFEFIIEEKNYKVSLIEALDQRVRFEFEGIQYLFTVNSEGTNFYIHNESTGAIHLIQKDRFPDIYEEAIEGGFEAPMPSQIVRVLVKNGQSVKEGDALIILSSMKMENTIYADKKGTIEEVFAQEGSNVEAGFLLLKLSEN